MGHPEFPKCPLCPANGKVNILAETNGLYVVRSKDESFEDLNDRLLIVPVEHAVTPEELPVGWGETLVELSRTMDMLDDFNWSMNIGSKAGQTLDHLHWWCLDRRTDDIGKGMSWMIQRIPELEAANCRLQQSVSDLEFEKMEYAAENTALRRHSNLQLNG